MARSRRSLLLEAVRLGPGRSRWRTCRGLACVPCDSCFLALATAILGAVAGGNLLLILLDMSGPVQPVTATVRARRIRCRQMSSRRHIPIAVLATDLKNHLSDIGDKTSSVRSCTTSESIAPSSRQWLGASYLWLVPVLLQVQADAARRSVQGQRQPETVSVRASALLRKLASADAVI